MMFVFIDNKGFQNHFIFRISPIKIHRLYPEQNAQFTFFAGLSNIARIVESEWREHYFRSCMMRPATHNEGHFKALVKHISEKREVSKYINIL